MYNVAHLLTIFTVKKQ